MWNKKTRNGREYFTRNSNSKLHEYSHGDIDKINANPAKWSLGYTFQRVGMIEEELDYEYTTLPSGIYRVECVHEEMLCFPFKLNQREECLEFSIVKDMQEDFKHFLESKKTYEKLSLLHKRGVLLFGPPGTGKTTLINKVIQGLVPENSLVLFVTKYLSNDFMNTLKKDDRLKVIIFEELTEAMKYDFRSALLDFLDGEMSTDNTFIIGTTNYPETLPTNIVNRPGRFDRFYKISYLKKEDIKKYMEFFLERIVDNQELDLFNKVTIAELKEMLLLTLRDNLTLKQAHDLIKEQGILVQKEFTSKKDVGFHRDEDDLEGIL